MVRTHVETFVTFPPGTSGVCVTPQEKRRVRRISRAPAVNYFTVYTATTGSWSEGQTPLTCVFGTFTLLSHSVEILEANA
jgi:hypothetical protein